MLCFNCGYNLPSHDINECPLCGMKFPIICHSCNTRNPLMAKHCFNCGSEIKKESVQSTIKNYDVLAENRKNVAVMFADVSGFTQLAETLDPEEVRELINDAFNYITKPVYELEGTIDKYIGDCVMILFGAKNSHSDDPKRAVMCGIEMQKLIMEFSNERLADKGISLSLAIGINYGLVVSGRVGNYFDKDYTVMGDIVNTAQRLQTSAKKGTILVSESVYSETKDSIEYSPLKEISVKNKKNTIKSYMPLDIKTEQNHEQTTLVDREEIISRLLSISNNSNQLQWITVIGEAGIGKTSLIEHYVANFTNAKKIWVSCSPHYQNRVYYVLSNIILNVMNLDWADTNRIKLNRLKSYIDFILKDNNFAEEDITKNQQFISLIMGLDRDKEFSDILNSMNYEDLQREIIKQLATFFEYTSKLYNYTYVIDDIQWADSGSLSIIKKLMRILPASTPSVFIFTSRYEIDEDQTDLDSEYNHTILLDKLSKNGIEKLSAKILEVDHLGNSLVEIIEKYTGGNPLYVKEFSKAIKRHRIFYLKDGFAYLDNEKNISLPKTVESLILSNISELDENARNFLQIAAIVGKEFSSLLVRNLLDKKVDEFGVINRLVKLNIISLHSINSLNGEIEKIYQFNQDTLREVLYDSILNKTKEELHIKIAELMETKYSLNIEDYFEILTEHYEKAQASAKALEYCYKTAIKNKNDFSFEAALKYFIKYIKTANNTKQKNEIQTLNSIIEVAQIYYYMADFDHALHYLNLALEKAVSTNDTSTIKIIIASIYKEMGSFQDALNLLDEIQGKIRQHSSLYGRVLQLKSSILSIIGNDEALKIAEESEEILLKTKDFENLSETMSQAAIIHFSNGDIDNSLYYLNKAYHYAEKISNLKGIARISGNLGIVYHSSGFISKALEHFEKSIEISKKISNISSIIAGNINLGILYMEKGLFTNAERLFFDALQKSEEVSQIYQATVALINLGDLLFEQGNYLQAIVHYERALKIAKETNLPIEEGIIYLGLAKVEMESKSFEKAKEFLDKSFEIIKATNNYSFIGDYYFVKSIYEFKYNHFEIAADYCLKSLENAIEVKNDMKKLQTLRLRGEILAEKGNYQVALELLDESIQLAEQLESDYEMAKGLFRKYQFLTRIKKNDEASIILDKTNKITSMVNEPSWRKIILQET